MKEAPFFRRLPPLRRLLWMHQVTGGGSGGILKTVTGTLLHITDALAKPAKKFVATLEPIQDLHGQDAPYPSGGGVNILDPNIKVTAGTYYGLSLTTANGYILSYSGTATESGNINTTAIAKDDAIILPAGTYIGGGGGIYSIYSASGSWLMNKYGGTAFTVDEPFYVRNVYWVITNGNTYNTSTFIALAKGSTAPSSWSPYSNECPITGHTGASVYDTGKNLLDISVWTTGELNVNNGTVTPNSNKSVSPYIFLKSGTYTVSRLARSTGNWIKACLYDSEKVFANYLFNNTNLTNTFTLNSNGYIRIGTDYVAEESDHIQLELSSTATTYEEYKGTTIPITFPAEAGTVYGATLENHGTDAWKLRVNNVLATVSDFTWTAPNEQYSTFRAVVSGLKAVSNKANVISSAYKATTWDAIGVNDDNCIYGRTMSNTATINIKDTSQASKTAAQFKTDNASVQIVYELATPIEYTITESQAITLLKDTNNIWTDIPESELELTYLAKATE